ncbi:TetR family transcriptional regulator [Rhodococcus ruber]|nr:MULTISPECIES: TetR family transcriptional regulator [Rhodococcus]MDO2377127.1 TetR family transcriptional regulator [Rhodococcus ruber]RIK07775.1 MAG: TetR/AcrR family transcriptional regulator [Acidobacteriota bacterium]AUM18847.1 TetR/AcrR family transcriptional regulator [Rhodococcus ruber]MBD8055477.1 TetR/AcrR family transcriptional regulator [Rhodococcus ruber]MCD2124976.1 TetR family transcriptional regulator [Rhodococcus ruber]
MTPAQLRRRDRITEAVVAMLEETGPDSIQMRDVAERSGVALGTLYRYFPAKPQLLAAAMVAWNDRLSQRLATERRRRSDRDARAEDAVERVVRLYVRQMKAFQRGPHFARLEVELQTSRDPYVVETLVERSAVNRSAVFEAMEGIPAERARLASLAIGSTMLTSLMLWTTDRIRFAEALRNVEDVCRLVLSDRPVTS